MSFVLEVSELEFTAVDEVPLVCTKPLLTVASTPGMFIPTDASKLIAFEKEVVAELEITAFLLLEKDISVSPSWLFVPRLVQCGACI